MILFLLLLILLILYMINNINSIEIDNNEVNSNDLNGVVSEIKPTGDVVQVDAVDSDYLFLLSKPSSLPIDGIGLGVFAKDTIEANSIICEYRGPIITEEAKRKFPYNDKYFNVKVDNEGFAILGEGVCSVINDCSNAWKLLRENETLVDEPNDPSKCYDTYEYNAKAIGSGYKVFIVATRDIKPNEEIFYSYSWSYWRHHSFITKKFNLTSTAPIYTSSNKK